MKPNGTLTLSKAKYDHKCQYTQYKLFLDTIWIDGWVMMLLKGSFMSKFHGLDSLFMLSHIYDLCLLSL